MRKSFNQHTQEQFSWLKWSVLGLSIVMVGIFTYGMFLYVDIQKSKTAGFEETKEKVLRETEIVITESIERFHGDEFYHVVTGKTSEGEGKIAFVPQTNEESDLVIIDQTKVKPRNSIMDEWNKKCNNCKMIKITPGIINNENIWEITYRDESNRLVLEYVSIYDGSQYEQYRFTRMFK